MDWKVKNQKNKAVVWNYWQRMNSANLMRSKVSARKHSIEILTGMDRNLSITSAESMI
jgi:hypothetical protein